MSVAEPPESVPGELLNAVRAVYRERTAESVVRLREAAMAAGKERHPKVIAFSVLCEAIEIVSREVKPVVLNLYSGLFEGR